MPTAYKLSQVQGTSGVGTYATLYATGSGKQAVISTIVVCNTASSSATYRIGVDDTEGTPGNSEWLVYDAPIAGNDSLFLSIGLSVQANKVIRVSSSANTVVFSASVSEIS